VKMNTYEWNEFKESGITLTVSKKASSNAFLLNPNNIEEPLLSLRGGHSNDRDPALIGFSVVVMLIFIFRLV
jgi:hypothetical protein